MKIGKKTLTALSSMALAVTLAPVGLTHAAPTSSSVSPFSVAGDQITQISSVASKQFNGHWFSGKTPFNLSSSTYYIVHGKPLNDGSGRYHYHYSLTTKNGSVSIIELAVNESTHEQLVAIGPAISSSASQPSNGSQASSTSGTVKRTSSSSTSSVTPNTQYYNNGSWKTTWEDPANLALNSVEDDIYFHYDGSSIDDYSGADHRYWLSNDGWYEVNHSISSSNASDWSWAAVGTNAEYENDIFCSGVSTMTWYSPNSIEAHPDGSVSGYVDTYDGGGCTSLIRYYSTLNGVIQ